MVNLPENLAVSLQIILLENLRQYQQKSQQLCLQESLLDSHQWCHHLNLRVSPVANHLVNLLASRLSILLEIHRQNRQGYLRMCHLENLQVSLQENLQGSLPVNQMENQAVSLQEDRQANQP